MIFQDWGNMFFREILDCVHFFSAPGLARQETLTDMLEKGIKGETYNAIH